MRFTLVLVACCLIASAALSADWAQFRGPGRDGKSPETGLLQEWPEGGPEALWTAKELGNGYSSPEQYWDISERACQIVK